MSRSESHNRKRFYLIAAGLLILFIISYLAAFKKTINIYTEFKQLQSQSNAAENPDPELKKLKIQIKQLDKLLEFTNSNTSTCRQQLLEHAALYSDTFGINLSDFPESVHAYKYGYHIETNSITLQGNFSSLLQYTSRLEQGFSAGKILSVSYSNIYNPALKKNILTEKLFIRTIKKNTDE